MSPVSFIRKDPSEFVLLLDLAEKLDKDRFQILPPKAASRSDIESRHGADYVKLVESTSKTNHYALDGDTITCRDSFGVGLLAVGGFLRLIDSIAAGESQNGFALVRPPGHHALRNRAMGFCLFNTIAIGAEHLKNAYDVKRVMIMDWDVHHGNGTQDSFYEDPSVLFISTHQFPYYPGTGAVNEVGLNAGEGYTINIPLPAGCGDAEYMRVFHDVVLPAAEKFEPQWILVSAGFDPHRRDPLGGMELTEAGFAGMARLLLQLADRYAGGKIAFLTRRRIRSRRAESFRRGGTRSDATKLADDGKCQTGQATESNLWFAESSKCTKNIAKAKILLTLSRDCFIY